jgi:hypothetical protein
LLHVTAGRQLRSHEARQHRQQAGESEKVLTYWHIGDALVRRFQSRPDPGCGEQSVDNLSNYIKLNTSTLYDVVRFRRLLPSFRTCGELT